MNLRFWERLSNVWSREVPPELAACEFDCREDECSSEDFEQCSRRQQKAEAIKRLSQEEAP